VRESWLRCRVPATPDGRWSHLHPVAFASLLVVFAYFTYDMYQFRAECDADFTLLESSDFLPHTAAPSQRAAGQETPSPGRASGASPGRSVRERSTTAGRSSAVSFEEGAGLSPSGLTRIQEQARAYDELRGDDDAPTEGWLLKSSSRHGPLSSRKSTGSGSAAGSAQDRRYFALRKHELKWYGTEDAATLSSAPRDQVDLRAYAVQLVDAAAYSLALVPLDASSKKKSWYIRAMDQQSFNLWYAAFSAVAAEVRGGDAMGEP